MTRLSTCASWSVFLLAGLFAQTPALAQTCVDAPAGLISWWTGDGTTDDLLGVNNGTPEGGIGYQPGVVGDAFSLDGIDDAVLLPDMDAELPSIGFTYTAWVKRNTETPLNTWRTILGSWTNGWDEFILHGGNGYKVDYQFYDISAADACNSYSQHNLSTNADEWTFVSASYDGQTLIVRMNDQSAGFACPGYEASRRVRWIGRSQAAGVQHLRFFGLIDEVAVFDRALSAAELNAIYDAGSAGMCKADAIKNIAEQKATEIVQQILGLNLQQGIENSLDAKLSSALNALDDMNDNNDVAAVNSLEAAINAIEAQRGNKIPTADADALIQAIQDVIDLLNSVI